VIARPPRPFVEEIPWLLWLTGLVGLLSVTCRPESLTTVEVSPFDVLDHRLVSPPGVSAVVIEGCQWSVDQSPGAAAMLRPEREPCDLPLVRQRWGELTAPATAGDRTVRFRMPNFAVQDVGEWPMLLVEEGRVHIVASDIMAVACFVGDGPWRILRIDTVPGGTMITETEAATTFKSEPDCVVKFKDGRVRHLSLPASTNIVAATVITGGLVLAVLALVLSFWLLRGFRRHVLRSLRTESEVAAAPETSDLVSHGAAATVSAPSGDLLPAVTGAAAMKLFRKQRLVYVAVAVSCGLALALAWAPQFDRMSLQRLLFMTAAFCWTVPVILIAFFNSSRWAMALYLVLVIGGSWALAGMSPRDSLMFLLVNSVPVLPALLLLTLHATRNAAPWVYALLLLLFGPLGLMGLVAVARPGFIVTVGSALGIEDAVVVMVLIGAAVLVLSAVLVVAVIKRLVNAFSAMLLNDRIFGVAPFLAAFCVIEAHVIGSRDIRFSLIGLSSLLPIAAALAFGAIRRRGITSGRRHPRVLFLRSFSGGKNTVDLFSRTKVYLLNVVPVDLIAGPDLASQLAEPHELVEFLGRQGGRKYIHDMDAFQARRDRTSGRLDIEGRHPVVEYYCGNAIWARVFLRLATEAAAVVIDVRRVSDPQSGTARELRELIWRVPLQKLVVLVDDSGPSDTVQAVVRDAWARLPAGSPNRDCSTEELPFFRCARATAGSAVQLTSRVCDVIREQA
jgi:hypothetical protein